MKYLLGIDFGGGASKATLIDEKGNIVAESTAEYPTLYPEPGCREQSPDDWIAALCKNTSELLENSGIDPADILCIAADSATHTFLPCDNNFASLMNAVHWTDTRSRAEANALKSEKGDEIFKKTFHKPDTIWTLPQLLWLKNSRPEVFSKIGHIFFEKDYIRYFLTGVFCTDYIEAQGSMLYDCVSQKWSDELCALCGIDISVLAAYCGTYRCYREDTGKQLPKKRDLKQARRSFAALPTPAWRFSPRELPKKGILPLSLQRRGAFALSPISPTPTATL